MASVPSVDGVSGYSEPRITEAGVNECACHHELESSVNLAPDRGTPGVQAGVSTSRDVPPAMAKC